MSVKEQAEALKEAFGEFVDGLMEATAKAVKAGGGVAKAAPDAEAEEPKRKRGKKAAAKAVSKEDVRTALLALAEAKSKDAVVELLSRYGVTKVGDLDEESYAECVELAEAEAADDGDTDDADDAKDLFD